MAANGGYRVFNTGDVLTAAQVQYYLQNQTVMYFATTTARDAALTGATLVEGMVSYTPATGVMVYNGSAWVATGTTSPLTTKGDVWGYSTTNARVPVGADNTVLTADSTQALGVKWATPSSGGMTLLSTTNLSGTSTTISSISGSYTNLFIVIQNPYVNVGSLLKLNPNGVGYNLTQAESASVSDRATLGTQNLPTASNPTFVNFAITIYNYSDTTYGKPVIFSGSEQTDGAGLLGGGVYSTASAITSLTFTTTSGTSTFSGGRVLIYGVK